ncbi:MAG: hypothetical protein KF823_15565 [Xanthomonadales bacterium]|nr:hypothetical protein [Xanthomonadales bacterium]
MPTAHLAFPHAALAWLAILVLAIGNGLLREAVLVPRLGRVAGIVASGLLLIAAVFAVAWLLLRWRPARSPAQAGCLGLGWLAATLVFETGFGLVRGLTWPELVSAYTFADGNLWPLVLVALVLAPVWVTRHRNKVAALRR